ncbi:sister chromatid cohesion protein PDS5 homolog A-like isoform X1 [Coffea arabica]|uniref:Sister chromatid cohesion protein PDS5 homolog A-like isoform X1 n=2 Tax=Coffea arabica TaxID=13443 RepID=A0ABM4VRX4_COFAR
MANQKLLLQLKELGSKLDNPPSTKDSLIKLLKQGATCLSDLEQSPPKAVMESMQPFVNVVVKPELLKHQDREVKLLVATCICEITRITAPEAPYTDDILKDIFHLIVSTFGGLSDTSSPYFGRRVVILETLAKYRSCVVMLDLECDDLITEMFSTFFSVARDEHPENVLTSMETIMAVLLDESEDVWEDVILNVLSNLGRDKKDVTTAARRLAMNVIKRCAGKLEPSIKQFLISSMSGDSRSSKYQIDYYEVIYDIFHSVPQILSGVVPYLTGELLTDQLDTRLKAVKLVGDLFALPGSTIPETFQPILMEFLKRLTDRVVEVRMSVLNHIRVCLLSDPFRSEAPQIIAALGDRLMDYDENVRKQVVAVICDVACHDLTSIPVDTIKLVSERLRDKSLLVKKFTMERLAEIYKNYCMSCSNESTKSDSYDWIPGKILRCFYDKDFRSDTVEPILSLSLFPSEFPVEHKVKNWVRSFGGFDKVEVKALEKILEQKQRLQQEMQKYLSLRQMYQDGDANEIQKKVLFCFRVMSRCFTDPFKAEESFQILDQLKDANIWRILRTLLDPNTTPTQASNSRDDLLRILGEKHRLFEFLNILSLKCANLLFSKEHTKEIILEADIQKSAGNAQLIVSCMSILVILARFSPFLLSGIEEDLIHLLDDDNEIIKEGVLHVLARAGGAIRDQLGVSSRSLDLMLERICLEGSRRQAKYAVHALASITKDDGLMSLSVLYRKLVDMLTEKSHLPAVLQSLGCIAQTAMPVFETREKEIEGFIMKNILECSSASEDRVKECFDDQSELCSLKIFGIKTLVKSYLPVKDAHLRLGINDLIGVLKSILCYGEISQEIESSYVDKAHLRLAAAKAVLRLSKHWDHEIPVDVFYLTLGISEASFPEVRRLFLSKIYQYIKDRLLDPKYAIAFLLDMGSQQQLLEEEQHNLMDIIQMCQQGRARHYSAPSDANTPPLYPEYVLLYLVHAFAHNSSFPNPDECKDVKAYESFYRQLYFFLSMLVHGDEDGKSDIDISKDKESLSAIISIFESIKRSEDNVDSTKSKKLYAICDLGLSITKRLAPKQEDLQGCSAPVPLPAVLYKSNETKEGSDSVTREKTLVDMEGTVVAQQKVGESRTWLADESVLTYFQSIKLEANKAVTQEVVEDESMKDSETDGSEMPLGKIIKRLKAKGAKARREVKNESAQSVQKNENDLDILKMVREINSDNLGDSSKFGSSNGHEYVLKEMKADRKLQKRKTMLDESKNVPVPKRRRSSSSLVHKSPAKNTSKEELPYSEVMDEGFKTGSEERSSRQKMNEPEESDLLVSCIQKDSNPSFPSKHKGKRSFRGHDKGHEARLLGNDEQKKYKKTMDTDSDVATNNSNSAATKKQKRRSVAGLAKCSSKESDASIGDLIGCRIKVWWPMDKRYYEGVVKSFDTEKKKHVILYDDGDVEVLRLEKERWEIIDKEQKLRSKSSKRSGSKGRSKTHQKRKASDVSGQKEKILDLSPSSQARGKRTPRKNVKHGKADVSKDQVQASFESGGSPNLPDPVPEKSEDADSDEERQQSVGGEKGFASSEQNEKDEGSVSKGKEEEDAENMSIDSDKAQEESSSEAKPAEGVTESLHGDGSDKEEVSSSDEEKKPAVTRDAVEKSDSEDVHGDDAGIFGKEQHMSDEKTGSADEEISDDEPLSAWKRRVGKSAEGK